MVKGMNQLELLSPAGNILIYKAVVNAGADAVYFGGELFGARAYAKNFSLEEAKEAIAYGHLHGVKSYLTVNTLLKNPEIEGELYNYLKFYVKNDIDAFIVQDFGVFNLIRQFFPDTPIHVSTQTSVCTKYGAKFFEKLGAKRIVTAREISIDEIAKIHETCPDLEIESFVHGALCVCYSGQCLMSSIIGGRSGNRGRCAQPCRLPYNIAGNKNGDYVLSPKDFCTIEYLPQMIEAGVTSFKIEGRMKQLEYAAGVVSIYRHYIDKFLYKGAKNYSIDVEDMTCLMNLGNRSGFTSLYLHEHNGPEMITFEASGHTKESDNKFTYNEKKIKINCKVTALVNEPFKIIFNDDNGNLAEATSNMVEKANNKPTSEDDIIKAVSGLGNTPFILDKITVDCDEDIFLPVSIIKNARRDAIAKLIEKLIENKHKTINEFEILKVAENIIRTPKCFVTIQSIEQLNAILKYGFIDSIAVPEHLFNTAIDSFDGDVYITLPAVLREEYVDKIVIDDRAAGVLAESYDELGLLLDLDYPMDKIITDHRLYTFNNISIEGFKQIGIRTSCIPYELSLKELSHRLNNDSQMIIYSRIPMMITANCNIKNTKGCNKANEAVRLTDRKNESFISSCNCTYCYNTIYNSKKYIAFDLRDDILELGVKELRLDFTIEASKETEEILNAYERVFIKNESFIFNEDYTKGHLKRGVE